MRPKPPNPTIPAPPARPAEASSPPPPPPPPEPIPVSEDLLTSLGRALGKAVAEQFPAPATRPTADVPAIHAANAALSSALAARDWPTVAASLNVLVSAHGITLTPAERRAMQFALDAHLETAAITDPSPPPPAAGPEKK
jgi:hypothetical protein